MKCVEAALNIPSLLAQFSELRQSVQVSASALTTEEEDSAANHL